MRGTFFFLFMTLLCIQKAQATVYEYNSDGTVLKHEAFDYRSVHGEEQFDIVMPALVPAVKNSYEAAIQKASANYGLNANLIRAVIGTESAGKRDAVSSKGAQGLMQLMPATAKQYGVIDPFDPEQNIDGGAKYLSYLFMRYSGDSELALAAYNAGEGTIDRYGGIPPYAETKAYVKKIKSKLQNDLKN